MVAESRYILLKPTKTVVFHFDEMTNTATLIIVDAFSEHAGLYTCKAINSTGEAVCTAILTVTTEGKLTIVELKKFVVSVTHHH